MWPSYHFAPRVKFHLKKFTVSQKKKKELTNVFVFLLKLYIIEKNKTVRKYDLLASGEQRYLCIILHIQPD